MEIKEHDKQIRCLRAFDGEEYLGKLDIQVDCYTQPDAHYLTNLKVEPEHRRKGVAKALLEQAIKEFGNKQIILSARPFSDKPVSQADLKAFYERYGFVAYSEDGWDMAREATEAAE